MPHLQCPKLVLSGVRDSCLGWHHGHTNADAFPSGWVNNADLSELDPDDCTAEKAEKLKRKDLAQAYELAAQNNPLSYYKGLLAEYQAEILKAEEDKAAALLAKQKQKDEFDADGDVEMADVAEEGAEPKPKKTKTNKRKAEDSAEVSGPPTLPDMPPQLAYDPC